MSGFCFRFPCDERSGALNANISMIPYANLAPVRSLGCPDGFDFIYLTPRQSVEALRQGRVVAAALPTGAWPAVQELVGKVFNHPEFPDLLVI